MFVPNLLAAGGLLFAFEHATIAGKCVLLLLAIVSIFSWSIMITKMRVIRFAQKQNTRFLAAFRQDRQPLRLFEKNARFPGSPNFNVYRAGCREVTFHLLGSAEVDETFRGRLEIADKISSAQMGAVNAAMERAVGETALELESQMILLATAVLLEEPTIGLHMADINLLLNVLHRLVDEGHTVVVIEHNLSVIAEADYIVDLGPEAGAKGGEVVAFGTPEEVVKSRMSRTAPFLREVLGQKALQHRG